ncbi:MAG: S41 family peptidase [Candidatus Brocadiae bacterium]|nr:S41 family peptidase [Candidatus Brocadiia bacterium]
MKALQWFGGWIVPVGATAAIVLGAWHPILGGERGDVEKQEKKLRTIHEILRAGYVEEPDTAKLYDGAARGMLSSLDRHCQYFDPDEMKEFEMDTEGHYGGIGVQIEFMIEFLEISGVFEDTPAFKAGLVAGDRILSINGTTTEHMNSNEAARHIRGVPGTVVTLNVLRRATGKPEDVPITRAEIVIPSVKGTAIIDAKHGIGYVRLLQFQEESCAKLKAAIDGMMAKGLKGLILDLRFNGGGLLDQSEKIADLFLAKGVIVETKGRLEEANSRVEATKDGTYPDFPMVVLVNDGSASASEIVAGALQDHKRAVLVGSKTYGKGSVQQYLKGELGDGSGFKFTIARYFTPNGRWIDRKAGKDFGLEPDFVVDLTEKETLALMASWGDAKKKEGDEAFVDRQLEKATEVVRTLLWKEGGK